MRASLTVVFISTGKKVADRFSAKKGAIKKFLSNWTPEGLTRLQRTGTLPTVWIPPGDIRDKRELPRTRMVFAKSRTRLKNKIHSVFDKYGLHTVLQV